MITNAKQLADSLTEIMGEYVSEELCAKLTEGQFKYIYKLSHYAPTDLDKVREILMNVKKKVENANTATIRDAILQLKEDKNKEKIFDRFMSYSGAEIAGAIDKGDWSLLTLIQ